MPSDAELVEAALQGDRDAFGHLVNQYKDVVYGLALSLLRDFDEAYDASQEVFLRAFLRLGQLKEPEKLPAWLRAITGNVCRTWLAQRRNSVPLERLEREESVADYHRSPEIPDEALEREEERHVVLRALEELPPASRQVLTLDYLGERSAPEIAAFLGISPAAARQRLHRSRRQLRQEVLHMISDTLQREAPGDQFREEVDRLLDQARAHFATAEYWKAIPALEQVRQMDPEDSLVALLLADAHARGRTIEETETDPEPHRKAGVLLEELVAREPENLPARIRLAEHRSALGTFKEILAEHEDLLQRARGSKFEGWVLLRLAHVYFPRGRHGEAMECFQELIEVEPRFTGVACRGMGMSCFLQGDIPAAIDHFERGIRFLEGQPSGFIEEHTRDLMGERYEQFWAGVDQRLVSLQQDHVWLAGLHMKNQDPARAREHLQQALDLLDCRAIGPARPALVSDLLSQVDSTFPELAEEAAVQALDRGRPRSGQDE